LTYKELQMIELLHLDIRIIDSMILNPKEDDIRFTGTVFITFNNQSTIQDLLCIYKTKLSRTIKFLFCRICSDSYLQISGKPLLLQTAPAPSDVAWENLSFSFNKFLVKEFLLYFLSFGILYVSFNVQYFVMKHYRPYYEASYKVNDFTIKFSAIVLSLIVLAVNILLQQAIYFFIKKMEFPCKT